VRPGYAGLRLRDGREQSRGDVVTKTGRPDEGEREQDAAWQVEGPSGSPHLLGAALARLVRRLRGRSAR
jgi:hypothetical protein